MEELKLDALVLNTYPAKESDLVLVLLTEELGKIRAYARGARKSKKRFFGNIEIFTKAKFSLAKKSEAELYQIENLESKQTPLSLRNSLNHFVILSACYELTNKCTADLDIEIRTLFKDLDTITNLGNKLIPMDKFIPVVVFYLLKLGQNIGIDPTSHSSSFRQDDYLWFESMLRDNCPLKYEPIDSATRALKMLTNYLSTSMDTSINSIESLSLLKFN